VGSGFSGDFREDKWGQSPFHFSAMLDASHQWIRGGPDLAQTGMAALTASRTNLARAGSTQDREL